MARRAGVALSQAVTAPNRGTTSAGMPSRLGGLPWTVVAGCVFVAWLAAGACVEFPTVPQNESPQAFPCDADGLCPGVMTCEVSTNTCVGGGTASCPPPLSDCDGTCVLLAANDAHCGVCNNACPAGGACINAACSGQPLGCLGCGPGVACVAGACSCQGRGELCTVLCMDTQQSSISCGTCFQPCMGDQVCRGGTCVCPPDTALCDGSCRDIQTDTAHCGGCSPCPGTQRCQRGVCVDVCTINTVDACGDGRCWDTQTDSRHCGASCAACDQGAACVAGACQCPANSIQCPSGCVDTQRDSQHCGGCGNACAVGESCVGGSCTCATGLTRCGGACVSTQDDANHCGACDAPCGPASVCLDGVCAASCPMGREACTGFCLGHAHPGHCGGCQDVCSPGELCLDGSCEESVPAVGCTACPCSVCDVEDNKLCCMQNGAPVCVGGMRCPP